ncbi:tRNA lysidine(34) synthetase TilS [candidate division KSB1 bacterium]|nr:tRNA lysidine(34) synthetase TilS [candidate division KSB1 bacterium]MBL7092630.1 tRNA lysidine(34) synthetase TilS [candidate division KSB1 bacterium]
MPTLIKIFETFLAQHHLIKSNDYLLIAVSGGVDSVVLLDLLFQLKDKLKLKLEVIHLNHGIREEEALRDAKFVEQLVKKYQLPLVLEKVNVPDFSKQHRLSEEEGARVLRYRFFKYILGETGADWVALGHHADDQVETVLDHFMRGSGIKGLCGMPFKRDKYLRPLLYVTRKEIETYADDLSLEYLIDSTNEMVKYRRNRIRHELIPQIKEHFNPGINTVVLRTAAIADEVEEYLCSQAQTALDECLIYLKKNKIILDIDSFLNYFTVIQKYVLFQILEKWQVDRSLLTTEKIDRVLKLVQNRKPGKKIFLDSNKSVQIDQNKIVFFKTKPSDFEFEIKKNIEYSLPQSNLKFIAEDIDTESLPQNFLTDPNIEYIDAEKIIGKLKIRNFRVGDKFRPLNMKGMKKVSDYFTDEKVPLHMRNEIPILVCDSGIIWIIGYQIDNSYKISDASKLILKLQVK